MPLNSTLHYKQNNLYLESVPVTAIAEAYGTPVYAYSQAAIESAWQQFDNAFKGCPHRICYAVKANSNIAILHLLARLGSGFDIVSRGELERVLAAKGDPKKIVFSGVGKQDDEIIRALEVGIFCFNVESESELTQLNRLAQQENTIASIALRINPNIDAKTHPYIATGLKDNKFGIALDKVMPICRTLKNFPHLKLIGIGCHIGSQLMELEPFTEALDCLLQIDQQIADLGITLQTLDIGGGLGITYQDESPPAIQAYADLLRSRLHGIHRELILEPGRAIVGNAGILLTTALHVKHTEYKNFVVVDAGMNDLMRPALYDAWQKIIPVTQRADAAAELYDIVGPVCESADFLGKERQLSVQAGDLLAICSAGAYGFSMSSNYNSRPRAAEILIDGSQMHVIRERETYEELFAREKLVTISEVKAR